MGIGSGCPTAPAAVRLGTGTAAHMGRMAIAARGPQRCRGLCTRPHRRCDQFGLVPVETFPLTSVGFGSGPAGLSRDSDSADVGGAWCGSRLTVPPAFSVLFPSDFGALVPYSTPIPGQGQLQQRQSTLSGEKSPQTGHKQSSF